MDINLSKLWKVDEDREKPVMLQPARVGHHLVTEQPPQNKQKH